MFFFCLFVVKKISHKIFLCKCNHNLLIGHNILLIRKLMFYYLYKPREIKKVKQMPSRTFELAD